MAIWLNQGLALSTVYEVTRNATAMGRFTTPTLRNIALTSLHDMHNGSVATLEQLLEHDRVGNRTLTDPALLINPAFSAPHSNRG